MRVTIDAASTTVAFKEMHTSTHETVVGRGAMELKDIKFVPGVKVPK